MAQSKTFLVALAIITGALSQVISNDPASQSTRCVAAPGHRYWYDEEEIQDSLVDETGERCFKPLPHETTVGLLTKTSLDEVFAEATAQICPTWASSKKCLQRHLETECSSEERSAVKDDYNFNEVLVLTQLLCEPPNGFSLLNTFKKGAVDGGLGDCLVSDDFSDAMRQCQPYLDNRALPSTPFATRVSIIYKCSVEPMKTCSRGNKTREGEMHHQWKGSIDAIIAAKASLRRQLEAPEKPVLSDLITGFTALI